jgi:hypothetical protein
VATIFRHEHGQDRGSISRSTALRGSQSDGCPSPAIRFGKFLWQGTAERLDSDFEILNLPDARKCNIGHPCLFLRCRCRSIFAIVGPFCLLIFAVEHRHIPFEKASEFYKDLHGDRTDSDNYHSITRISIGRDDIGGIDSFQHHNKSKRV